MLLIAVLCLFFLIPGYTGAQDLDLAQDRDSIPQALRQPQRGEAPRYPRDLIIGSLERGDVPAEARRAALEIMAALSAGNRDAPSLAFIGPMVRGELISSLEEIRPRTYRVGEGREEADGSCSFLVRFLGREQGIAGELYLRFRLPQPEKPDKTEDLDSTDDPAEDPEESAVRTAPAVTLPATGAWVLDDLLLEEKHSLGEIVKEPLFDLPPYERLY
jgi:hypothetical protein